MDRRLARFFLTVLGLACFATTAAQAFDPATVRQLPATKVTTQLWGEEIRYRRVETDNPEWMFDGGSFRDPATGDFYLLLNRAFLQREAKQLFERFASATQAPTRPQLGAIAGLQDRLSAGDAPDRIRLSAAQQDALQTLTEWLEWQAWHPLFVSTQRNEARFVERFIAQRLRSVEQHERSHLVDLQRIRTDAKTGKKFTAWTELNAFFTELAFAASPHDVMAHALSGLLTELESGQILDYSGAKVAAVLRQLTNPPSPSTISGLDCCLHFSKTAWAALGSRLYQQSTRQPS